jgi:uncharacterized membrane protein YdjX (TVP38/TMEM64 family)
VKRVARGAAITERAHTRRSWRTLLWLLLLGGIALFVVLGGPQYFTLEAIKSHADLLVALTAGHKLAAVTTAALAYILAAALTLPIGGVLALASGFLFGRWTSLVMIVLAGTAGATLALLEARYLFADAARARLGPRAQQIDQGIQRNAFSYMLFLRVVPFPYVLVNLAAALSSIRLRVFVPATLIGLIPGAFVYSTVGETLGQIDSMSDVLSLRTLAPLAALGALALLPALVTRTNPDR